MSSLLSDLLADRHEFLIEKGNLPEAREVLATVKPISSPWTGEKSWTSLGYKARISHFSCRCGSETFLLTSLTHVERAPSGTIKETALDLNTHLQFPPADRFPTETTFIPSKICASCLPSNFIAA